MMPSAPPLRVLVVDDDPAVRELCLRGLRRSGCEVAGAVDATAALGVLTTHAWDVLVTDHHLPTITGLELLAAVQRAAPGLSVILFSARLTRELAVAARQAGATAVLAKPFAMAELAAAVQAAGAATRAWAPPGPPPAA